MTSSDGKITMGRNIKRLIKKQGITAAQLADILGVSTATVSDWSNGKTYPRIAKIEAMAAYFGVQKADLVEDPQTISASASDEPILMAAHWGIDISSLPDAERRRVIDRAKAYVEGLIANYEDIDA